MNHHLHERLEGIRLMLCAVHQAGAPLASAAKGLERAKFVELLLARALPNPYRFGTGCITDAWSRRSGEVDVVVELPFVPNVPSLSDAMPGLYLAEGVAAAIEVKSDLGNQWNQVVRQADALSELRRTFGATFRRRGSPEADRVPMFAVGYQGPRTRETLESRINESSVAGALVIDPGIFVVKRSFFPSASDQTVGLTGPEALWGLICALHWVASSLNAMADPLAYLSSNGPPDAYPSWHAVG